MDENILVNFGGYKQNNLEYIFKLQFADNDESEDNISSITSPYYSHDKLSDILVDQKAKFSVLSLNVQSINSKFDKLILFIEGLKINNFEFGAICLQETWLEEGVDLSQFNIPNYSCISQGRSCSKHGGLITYVHDKYNYDLYRNIDQSNIWEGQVIRIYNLNNLKDIYLCNSYRPPRGNITDDSLLPFIEDINNILSELNKSKSIIALLGDFNINLLQYNNSSAVRDYLNNIISLGLYPKITLPTRLTDHSATLIDNIFCNCYNDNSLSVGILLSDLSDHFPYFCVLNEDRDYKKKHTKNCISS